MLRDGTIHHRYFYSWPYAPLMTQKRREYRSTSVLNPLLYAQQVPPVAHLATLFRNFLESFNQEPEIKISIFRHQKSIPTAHNRGYSLVCSRNALLQMVGIEWPVNSYCSTEIEISNLSVQNLLRPLTSGDALWQPVGTLSYRRSG